MVLKKSKNLCGGKGERWPLRLEKPEQSEKIREDLIKQI